MLDPRLRSLRSLLRLRHVETDQARRDLGEALTHETALTTRDSAIRAELDAARRMTGDFDRDAFAAWWRQRRDERLRLVDARRDAEAKTAAARDLLARCRLAETAAEDALAREVAAREAEAQRRDQIVLEDVSRALKRRRTD